MFFGHFKVFFSTIIKILFLPSMSDTGPRVHKETENEDQAQDQIDKFP